MSSSYTVLTTIVILLIIFLYLSWVLVSIKVVDKEQEGRANKRRDFLFTATYTLGAIGLGATIWPFIDQMNPDNLCKL